MKDEVKRIMKLVEEGKLSADDALELIEAFDSTAAEDSQAEPADVGASNQESGSQTEGSPPPPMGDKPTDPFSNLIGAIEKLGKDVASNVDWKEISSQARQSAKKGLDAVKVAVDQAKQGKSPFGIFGNVVSKTIDLPLSIPTGGQIRIENPAGDVRVLGNQPVSSIQAVAKVRSLDIEDARTKIEQYSLVVEESGKQVLIKQPDINGLSVDLEIHLIDATPIDIRSEAGDIDVSGTAASCRVQTKSGDVRLRGVTSVVEVELSSGDVSILNSEASNVSVESKSGNIRLEHVKGNLNVRSASGDVFLWCCSAKTVAVEAVAGDVDVDLESPVDGTVNVRTVHGDASVHITDASNSRVALSTLSGDVACDIELSNEARQQGRVTGQLGEGLGSIDVSAVSGDVSLDQRPHSC